MRPQGCHGTHGGGKMRNAQKRKFRDFTSGMFRLVLFDLEIGSDSPTGHPKPFQESIEQSLFRRTG
jgi:hypothetical protein